RRRSFSVSSNRGYASMVLIADPPSCESRVASAFGRLKHGNADQFIIAVVQENSLVLQIDRFRRPLRPMEADVQHVGFLIEVDPHFRSRKAPHLRGQGTREGNCAGLVLWLHFDHTMLLRLIFRVRKAVITNPSVVDSSR